MSAADEAKLAKEAARTWWWITAVTTVITLAGALVSNVPGVQNWFRSLQTASPHVYVALLVIFGLGVISSTVAFFLQRHRLAETRIRAAKYDDAKAEADRLARENGTLSADCRHKAASLAQAHKQLEAVKNCDGRHWLQPSYRPQRFISLAERQRDFNSRTKVVSFINFKGGVGKSSIAVNVGHIYAKQGKRILFIDLDFQGTLSRLCVDEETLRNTERAGLASDCLLTYSERTDKDIEQLMKRLARPYTHFDGERNHVIIAREELATVEFRDEVRWLVDSANEVPSYDVDARFRLRKVLHMPYVFHNYDLVLLDCPPRQTAASVNAIACSDHIVIPAQIDQNAGDALPRTIHWLDSVLLPINPTAQISGVIGTMSKTRIGNLTKVYDENYRQMADLLKPFSKVTLFDATVEFDTAIAKASLARQPVALHSDLFNGVADELARRIQLT